MRKVMPVILVALMLFVSANTAMAADNTLDIEKVAIAAVKNSLDVQSMDRKVNQAQKNKADIDAAVNGQRSIAAISGQVPYQMTENIALLPIQANQILTLLSNTQTVTVNAVRNGSYSAYIGLLKLNYALNIQKSLVDSLAADYKKAQQEFDLGMITQAQLRLSEIAYIKAQYSYDSLQKSFNSTSLAVNNLMGNDLSTQYSALLDYNITPVTQIKPLNDYINQALESRAEILNDQCTLNYDKKAYEYGQSAIPTDFLFYKQQQQYLIDNDQNYIDLDKLSVQQDIVKHYKSLQNAMKNLEKMKALDDQAELSYQAAQAAYNTSQITLKTFGDAKIAKASADMNYKNAQFDAWLEQTTMDMACGTGYQPSASLARGLQTGQSSSKNKPDPESKKPLNDK